MRDYGVTYKSVSLMCDSSSAIFLAHNPVFHGRANKIEKGEIEMKFIDTERQLADIFIKPLDSSHLASLWVELGVCHPYVLV
jgi:hypothetical protein